MLFKKNRNETGKPNSKFGYDNNIRWFIGSFYIKWLKQLVDSLADPIVETEKKEPGRIEFSFPASFLFFFWITSLSSSLNANYAIHLETLESIWRISLATFIAALFIVRFRFSKFLSPQLMAFFKVTVISRFAFYYKKKNENVNTQ